MKYVHFCFGVGTVAVQVMFTNEKQTKLQFKEKLKYYKFIYFLIGLPHFGMIVIVVMHSFVTSSQRTLPSVSEAADKINHEVYSVLQSLKSFPGLRRHFSTSKTMK